MKKCDYFKDLILTEYIDGQLDKKFAQGVEGHLLDCRECQVFLEEVKNITAFPFQKALEEPVPTVLWDSIRQGIEHENQRINPFAEFINKLKGLVVFPRLVPVFASLILMLLVGSVTLNTFNTHQAMEKDQGEYLASLLQPTGALVSPDNNDWGTPIEHYFL